MKTIVGYKIKDSNYELAAAHICSSDINEMVRIWANNNKNYGFYFANNSVVEKKLKKAGVLDIWFEPVNKNKLPKINGWDGEIKDDCVKYGCAYLSIKNIKRLNKLIGHWSGVYQNTKDNSHNRTIKSITLDSGVVITSDEIKDITSRI